MQAQGMSNNKTQSGKVKVNGDKTILQKFNIKGKQLTDVKMAMKSTRSLTLVCTSCCENLKNI